MKKTASRLALAAGFSLVASSAFAADLGGNCCADLEERIAELEATTVRKGNRVMSLQLYGQVNRVMLWHDDEDFGNGRDDTITFLDNEGRSGSRFGFRGSANLNTDVSIGYRIELTIDGNVGTGSTRRPGTGVRLANVYVDSKRLGRVTLGQQNTATEGITEISLAGYFTLGGSESDGTVSGIASLAAPDTDGSRREGIGYTSAVLYGFTFSAFYGQARNGLNREDWWDVALRYAQEFNGIRVAAGVGYRESDIEDETDGKVQILGGSAGAQHVPTGLFISGSYSDVDFDNVAPQLVVVTPTSSVGGAFGTIGANELTLVGLDIRKWALQAGISRKFTALGTTTLAAQYGQADYDGTATIADIDTQFFGVGIVQNIDATATDVYAHYNHYELDLGSNLTANDSINDDVNVFGVGMRVKF